MLNLYSSADILLFKKFNYAISKMTWYPAYALGVCLVFQLFLYSALGTVVEIAVNKLHIFKSSRL